VTRVPGLVVLTSGAARRLAAVVMVVALVASCGSSSPSSPVPSPDATLEPAATPSPVASKVISTPIPLPTPSPSLTAAPGSSGWPVTNVSGTVIGPDGTAYAWMGDGDSELLIAALDPSGAMRPGWPFRVTRRAYTPSLDVGADGSLLVGTHDEDGPGFQLDRVGPDGREVAGWPYRDDAASYCSPPVAGANGAIVLACSQRGGQSSMIVVIDEAGRVVPGWPVTFDGVERLDSVQSGPDGTVYALGTPNDPVALARLWAYAADGSSRPGFPVTLESRVAEYLLVRDRILVSSYVPPDPPPDGLCGEAERTVLAEFDAAGRLVPGWPVSVKGMASQPEIGRDGTVYYLVRDRFFARGPDGSLRAGWPVTIPPVYPECAYYGPYLAADGTVYAIDDGLSLTAFAPDGRARPGWPFKPAHGFAEWFCTWDQPGSTSPVLGPDGRVYAAVVGTSDANGAPITLQVVALDSTGRVMPGWPYTLPGTGRGEVVLHTVVNGRVYLSVSRCGPSDNSTALLALDPDGSLSQ
jgi:hypothetical protein